MSDPGVPRKATVPMPDLETAPPRVPTVPLPNLEPQVQRHTVPMPGVEPPETRVGTAPMEEGVAPPPRSTGPAPSTMPWNMPEALVGRYSLGAELTTSDRADAFVYRATANPGTAGPADVIIKLYRRSAPDYDLDTVADLAAVGSRRIVPIVELGYTDAGAPFEVLEYFHGGTLLDRMQRKPLSRREAETVLAQLAEGLGVIHSAPVSAVHRDIKPENIVLRSMDGPLDVAIADFGLLARSARVWQYWMARLGLHEVGTRRYWSPSHLIGAPDGSADWWSVGLLMNELLCGRHPFDDGLGEISVERLMLTLHGNRKLTIGPFKDDRAEELVTGLTKFEPLLRWQYTPLSEDGNDNVRRWLAGESIPTQKTPTESPEPERRGAFEYTFAGTSYANYTPLAEAMLTDWKAGQRWSSDIPHLQELSAAARRAGDRALAERITTLADVFETNNYRPERRLLALAATLAPAVQPRFHGDELSLASLVADAQVVAGESASTPEAYANTVEKLRAIHATDALLEVAKFSEQDARLSSAQDSWTENSATPAAVREEAGIREVTDRITEQRDFLFGFSLLLALGDESERDRARAASLPAIGLDSALGQPWFATLMRHGANEFTDEDPRGGQVAAMSAYLAGLLLNAARSAELGQVRRESAAEPVGFPATPGGRREDIDYSEIADPPSAVGRHEVIPRPVLALRAPDWILRGNRRPTTRSVTSWLFRVSLLCGMAMLLFGLVRLVALDAMITVTPALPAQLTASGSVPLAWAWASLHSGWVAFPVFAVLDPLSAAGAFVPLSLGGALVIVSRLGVRATLPRMTAFKDVPRSHARRARITACVVGCCCLLVPLAPWLLLLALPLAMAIALPPRHPSQW